jgi:hypothetical protein
MLQPSARIGLSATWHICSTDFGYAPDLVEKVFAGGMTLQQAAEIARRKAKADDVCWKWKRDGLEPWFKKWRFDAESFMRTRKRAF